MSNETLRRVKRTFWQVLAGGTFTGVVVSYLTEDIKALVVALATALMSVLASWAQNALEDLEGIRDRR